MFTGKTTTKLLRTVLKPTGGYKRTQPRGERLLLRAVVRTYSVVLRSSKQNRWIQFDVGKINDNARAIPISNALDCIIRTKRKGDNVDRALLLIGIIW